MTGGAFAAPAAGPAPGPISAVRDWLDTLRAPVVTPADGRVLAGGLLVGVWTDLAVRSGVDGLAGAVTVLAVAFVLIGSGRLANPQAVVLAAMVPAFGVWPAVRTSPWLLVPDLVAAAGLAIAAASYARGGSVLRLTIPRGVLRALHAAVGGLGAPSFAFPRGETGRLRAVARGSLLALPLVALLGGLLASADAVFASIVRPATLVSHTWWVVFGAWAVVGLLRVASTAGPEPPSTWEPRIGRTEALVVVGALNVLFAAFATAQLVAATEGGRRVLDTAGLTYAEYAREGFFQLLAVAGITVLALGSLRVLVDHATRSTRTFRGTSLVAVVLTIFVCGIALQRLVLYERTFGLTMLRLYAMTAVVSIALVCLLLALQLHRPRRTWLPAAAAGIALVMVLAMNVLNPEAFVVRRNIAHAEATGRFDPAYVTSLGRDAIPAAVDGVARLNDPRDRAALTARLELACDMDERGWAAFNVAAAEARSAIRTLCPPREGG